MTTQKTSATGVAESCDYETIEEILANAECETSASEVQGFLCGILSSGPTALSSPWEAHFIATLNDGKALTGEPQNLLNALFLWTSEEMAKHESLAPMILPDDNYPLIDQLEALIEWCQGFLLGFGLQTDLHDINNAEVEEALTDLGEICRLELEAEEDNESQQAIFTLIEHVKVATQIIHWEMVLKHVSPQSSSNSSTPTIH